MGDYSFASFREPGGLTPSAPSGEPFDPVARRRRWLRGGEPSAAGGYVLYWMQMYRRARWNPALDEAVRRADALGLPLVVYEGLNPDYPEANDRIHRFVLECARDTAAQLRERGIRYVFWLRRRRDEERAVAAEMLRGAALAVVDDFPAFILPGITRAALERTTASEVPVLAVDGNGVVPLAEIPKREYAARTIRPKLHRRLPAYLPPREPPELGRESLGCEVPVEGIEGELEGAADGQLEALVAACEIDHSVLPSERFRGGRREALRRLGEFLEGPLARYAEESSDPGADVQSHLSPYLHFGCVSAQEVAVAVLRSGAPQPSVDDFLEQLVVRRELAYNFCRYASDPAGFGDLPDWARATMREHADDPRPELYSESELEEGRTGDELWNAAQRELVATGTMQGYLRMLWGKSLIRWTRSYEEAQRLMLRFHFRYALDGRNPNTYANVLWCFGLHDRAFAEREVLGKLRPLLSHSTRRKFDVEPYLRRAEAWR